MTEEVVILSGVREYVDRYTVTLVRNEQTGGRWAVRAVNEGGNNETLVDAFDLLRWIQSHLTANQIEGGFGLTIGAKTE